MQTVPRASDLIELSKQDTASLELVFRMKFIDLIKIIELFDSKQSQEFFKVNMAFMQETLKNHNHTNGGTCCNHNATSRYYIPRERMSTVDRIIDDKIFQNDLFFKENNYSNMHAILNQINVSFKTIHEKSKQAGMEMDEEKKK